MLSFHAMPGPLAARCSEIVRLGLLLVLLAGGASEAWAAGAQVTQFSPQATVKRVRQVSAVFSEAMVPLGEVGVWVGNFSGEPMRHVSGVTGAAPVWTEVMGWLHRSLPSAAPPPPAGVRAARVAFPGAVEPERSEWFLAGTEPRTPVPAVVSGHPRIIARVSGTIIALDPDIPEARQRLVFEAQVLGGTAHWVLDGSALGNARDVVVWGPTRGKHILALVDDHAGVLDQVRFEVRGGAVSARSAGRAE
jgi:penicillin-binding protein 1C